MKKTIAILLTAMMIISLSACTEKGGNDQKTETPSQTLTTNPNDESTENHSQTQTTIADTTTSPISSQPTVQTSAGTIEELENIIATDVENSINVLNDDWKTLSAKTTTYDEYVKNKKEIEDFYGKIKTNAEQLCNRLQEYAVKYAEMIMSSDMSKEDKYDAFEDLLDCIYDDAAEDVNDGIYDDLLEDMQDMLYEKVLKNSDDADNYSDWFNMRSDEYENWYDTRSDVYEKWYDTRSDLYGFYSDMRGKIWSNKIDKANDILADYKKDVDKLTKE